MTGDEIRAAGEFAYSLARSAGEITVRYFGSSMEVEQKADDSPVTRADRESEQFIRDRIHSTYPGHGVLGEEFGYERGEKPFTWVIDPIDGTKSFISAVPLYTVLVALVEGNWDGTHPIETERVLAGVIHAPAAGETVLASRGNGAVWIQGDRREPASVSNATTLARSRVLTTDWADLARRSPELFDTIRSTTAITRTWGDAYGYLLVATGRADLMIDPIMSPWDLGPLSIVVSEAGGVFSTVDGQRVLGESAVATTPAIGRLLFPGAAHN